MTAALEKLTARQRRLLDGWIPGAVVEQDLGWDHARTTVLRVRHGVAQLVVKAAVDGDTHCAREVEAHRRWLEPWRGAGRAPTLLHAEVDARILVTRYLPGRLVLGTGAADEPSTYRQAGELLAQLHGQAAVTDPEHERAQNLRSVAWLDGDHRIPGPVVAELRSAIASWPTPGAVLVPTHGDWHPRNWLVHEGVVRVIDLGRAALRPAQSDLARLAAQEFRRDATLERAFLDGYGTDPREAGSWHRTRVREAVATACWAHQVGDVAFEQQGLRMIAEALAAGRRA